MVETRLEYQPWHPAQQHGGRVLPAGARQEDVTVGGHVDAVDGILGRAQVQQAASSFVVQASSLLACSRG
jgi:hypothetical protein